MYSEGMGIIRAVVRNQFLNWKELYYPLCIEDSTCMPTYFSTNIDFYDTQNQMFTVRNSVCVLQKVRYVELD